MSAAHGIRLRYGGATVIARCAMPGHRDWLVECLAPAVEIDAQVDDAAPDLQVEFRADLDAFDRWQAHAAHPGGALLPAIDRDAQRVAWPQWTSLADEVRAFDPEFRVFVQVGPGRVVVLARDARPWTRVAWLRVVRQLLMEHVAASGAVFAHSAAFAVEGQVVLLAGPKRAGKTTLLVHALQATRTRFVANDRVCLRRATSCIDARGMPTLVNVRPGTRGFFPGRFDGPDDGPDTACFTAAERRIGGHPVVRAGPAQDTTLLPAHFAEAAGATMSGGGPLAAVLFPQQDPAVRGIQLQALDDIAARHAWSEAAFGVSGRDAMPTLFGGRCAEADSIEHAWTWLQEARIPLLRCRLGVDAYTEAADEFIETLRPWMRR